MTLVMTMTNMGDLRFSQRCC